MKLKLIYGYFVAATLNNFVLSYSDRPVAALSEQVSQRMAEWASFQIFFLAPEEPENSCVILQDLFVSPFHWVSNQKGMSQSQV